MWCGATTIKLPQHPKRPINEIRHGIHSSTEVGKPVDKMINFSFIVETNYFFQIQLMYIIFITNSILYGTPKYINKIISRNKCSKGGLNARKAISFR